MEIANEDYILTIDLLIERLESAKKHGDTHVKVKYGYMGYEQYAKLETFIKEKQNDITI